MGFGELPLVVHLLVNEKLIFYGKGLQNEDKQKK